MNLNNVLQESLNLMKSTPFFETSSFANGLVEFIHFGLTPEIINFYQYGG